MFDKNYINIFNTKGQEVRVPLKFNRDCLYPTKLGLSVNFK